MTRVDWLASSRRLWTPTMHATHRRESDETRGLAADDDAELRLLCHWSVQCLARNHRRHH